MLQRSIVRIAMFAILLATIAVAPACSKWKLGPGCTIRVVNNTGAPIRNLEVAYPGGTFGIPTLSADQIHMRWVQTKMDKGCHFTVKFEDTSGKQYASKDFNFAKSWPVEIAFNVDPVHNVTSTVLK